MNPRESAWESTLPRSHEDHIACKRVAFKSRNNEEHTFIPMLHAMKTSDAKAAANKEWQKLGKLPAWQVDKVKSKKKKSFLKNTEGEKKVHSVSLMDTCHLKNAELKTKAPEI